MTGVGRGLALQMARNVQPKFANICEEYYDSYFHRRIQTWERMHLMVINREGIKK